MSGEEGDDMVGELEGEGGVVVELCMSGEEGDDMVGELGRERGEICVSGEEGVGILDEGGGLDTRDIRTSMSSIQ